MTEKTRDVIVLKEAAPLTTAYDGWVSEVLNCRGLAEVELLLDIEKGDGTSIELKVDVDHRQGSAYYPRFAPVDGVTALDELQIDLADPNLDDKMALRFSVRSAYKIRLSAKKTGGSGAVTLACKVIGGGP